MKIITLPAEIEVLNLDQISDLIADALCPIESDDAEGLGYQLLRIDVDKEVTQDARAGLLMIRHPLTRKLQTTPTPAADILDRLFQATPFDVRYGVVLVADAAAYVAERGITLLVQTTDQTEAVKPASDAPEQSPTTPAPLNRTAKTRTWWDASSPYIVEIMRAGQFGSAKELYNELEAKAGSNSPFEKGAGAHRYSLFIRELAQPLSLKTVQNNWQKLLNAAA